MGQDTAELEVVVRGSGIDQTTQKMMGLDSAFTKTQASIVSFNQLWDLTNRIMGAAERVIGSVTRASGEQDRTIQSTAQTLRSTNQFTQEYLDSLVDLSGEFQRNSTLGDEVVLGVEKQLVAFGAARNEIPNLTEVVLDLSEGMGKDLSGATLVMGKALQGEFGTLSRYGIIVDENATQTEKLRQAVDQISRMFGGQAEAAARTFDGRLAQLANAWGEVEESTGNILTQSPAVLSFLQHGAELALHYAEKIENWRARNQDVIDQKLDGIFQAILEKAESLAEAIPNLSDTATTLGNALGLVGTGANAALTLLGPLATAINAVASAFNALPPELRNAILVGGTTLKLTGNPLASAGAATVAALGTFAQPGRTEQINDWIFGKDRKGKAPELVGPPEFVGPPEPPGFMGPMPPNDLRQRIEAARKAQEEAEKSAAGAADAAITRAATAYKLEDQKLQTLLDQVKANADLAVSSEQILAQAKDVESAKRRELDAQISSLQLDKEAKDLTAGERDAIQARIEALASERGSLDIVSKLRRQMADDEARRTDELNKQAEEVAKRMQDEAAALSAQRREFGLGPSLDDAARSYERIDVLARRGIISPEEVSIAQKHVRDELNQTADVGTRAMERLTDATQGWGREFTDTFVTAMNGGKASFKDLTRSILEDIEKLIVHETVTQPILDSVRSAIRGDFGGRKYDDDQIKARVAERAAGVAQQPVVDAAVASWTSGGDKVTTSWLDNADHVKQGFVGVLGALANGATTFLGALFGGGGSSLSVGGFLKDVGISFATNLGGKALGAGVDSLGSSSGGFDSAQADYLRDNFDVKIGSARRATIQGDSLRDYSKAGGGWNQKGGGDTVINVPVSLQVSSLDPSNAATVILQHEDKIVGMVARNISRGGVLSQAVGKRR